MGTVNDGVLWEKEIRVSLLGRMGLNAKVALLGVGSVLITAVALVALAVWQSGQYNRLAQSEVDGLIDADLDHITQGVYNLVQDRERGGPATDRLQPQCRATCPRQRRRGELVERNRALDGHQPVHRRTGHGSTAQDAGRRSVAGSEYRPRMSRPPWSMK